MVCVPRDGPRPIASPRRVSTRSGLQIAFPQIERYRLAWLGGLPPQLSGFETDAVQRLRVFAQPKSVRVGKDLRSMQTLHDAPLAPGVTREPGVPGRMDVARDDG